ncbi:hypothetical protein [Flavobacterium poyangense]|uniref:hypothetical protein n=1 Tax=Flavobacterium poyangense TaxID=2204302 RepID=UPI001AB03635|nr:hypothetical protein [Flavobacterium sp. JXAS1]
MRKKTIHNFNISIEDSTAISSSEQLTKDILKELAKVSKEMSQQKDIVQEWEEQKQRNAAAILNNSNTSIEGGATNKMIGTNNNPSVLAGTTPSVSEGAKSGLIASNVGGTGDGIISSVSSSTASKRGQITKGSTSSNSNSSITQVTKPISNAPTGEGVTDVTKGMTTSSSTSAGITSPVSGAVNGVSNLSSGLTTQAYAGVAALETVTVPDKLQTNTDEPTLEAIKEAIKKRLAAAKVTNDATVIAYWTSISKAFDEGAIAADFIDKPKDVLFTQMYALLKQANTKVIETQSFNWDIVRKKMIKAIDANILKGKISKESKLRWTAIVKQLSNDTINISNLFEQYDELFLLLKEVEGLDVLPNTITITTKTKVYPNLSADKLYAAIGKVEVYAFLRKMKDIQGSGVNKGAVKIKNAAVTSFIVGENLEFLVDEIFINENLHEKGNINWIIYNSKNKKDKGIVFADKGTSFNYIFETAGIYRIEAYGLNPGANNSKKENESAFVQVEIVAQEITITPPASSTGKFIRPSAETQSFKVDLKYPTVKTLNPLKLYYQVIYENAEKKSIISKEQELDTTGSISLVMSDLGQFTIKVFSKDQYGLSQNHSIKTIKNFVKSIIKEGNVKDTYLLKQTNQKAKFKADTFQIPATPQEKANVKWLVYDKNGIYIPDDWMLNLENDETKKPYLAKGESFTFPIPKKEGDFIIEAYSNSKEGSNSKSIKRIVVKDPQVTQTYWAYQDGTKKKTSGFAGEVNHIVASIPEYNKQSVRINFYLNGSKVPNYYNDTKTDENGNINKTIKFDTALQQRFGIQNSKTAKVRFELERLENGVVFPFKKNENAYKDAILNVTSGVKITDVYFMYEGSRVTPFTQVPYGAKVTGVVKTLNMIGNNVILKVSKKYAHYPQVKERAIVNNEGTIAINFTLNKDWHIMNSLLTLIDVYCIEIEGFESSLYFANGLNAVMRESKNAIKGGAKYGIDVQYFMAKYKDENKENLKNLLNDMNEYYTAEKITPRREQVAYILATVYTETFKTFKPVIESFWIKNKERREASYHRYDPVLANTEKRRKAAIENGNTKEGDGVKYCGRGYVQLTWKKNYKKIKDQFGVDTVNYPDKVLEPKLAVKILIWGMNNGIFTGVGINRYINDSKTDYVNARKVINGRDRSREIAADAEKFSKSLKIVQNPAGKTSNTGTVSIGEQKIKQNKNTDKNKNVDKKKSAIESKRKHSTIVSFARSLSQERIKQISNKTIEILEKAAIDSSNTSVIITSTIRNSLQQANAMYENESNGNHIDYAAPGEAVVKVYKDGVKNGKSKDEIIKLMAEKTDKLYKLGELVSRHCVSQEVFKSFNIVDVSYKYGIINPRDFIRSLVEFDAVTKIIHPYSSLGSGGKLLYDAKEGAIHVEIRQ